MIGVPDYAAYREKDMAQSGSGVHGLVETVADKHFAGKAVEEVKVTDKGSNYRYLDEDYGTPEMRADVHEMKKDI